MKVNAKNMVWTRAPKEYIITEDHVVPTQQKRR